MLNLSNAGPGKYRIVDINTDCSGAKRRLTTLGIFIGDEIEVTKPSPGPVIFKKGETNIGIGYGIATRILVVPLEKSKGAHQ